MKVIVSPSSLSGHPDLAAMLQAFYSRSHRGIEERLASLGDDADSIRAALERYYINYNHESIGDCGHITVFIEGVSFLTAKAIQDHPLYNGQETSSRYIDFSAQERPVYANDHYDFWMAQYRASLAPLNDALEKTMVGANKAAIRSAAFDIARGLLPTGALTQLSWHSSIRVMREHIASLLAHPIDIVRRDAENILVALATEMPNLFADIEKRAGYEWFLDSSQRTVGFSPSPLWRNINENNVSHSARFGTSVVRMNIDYGSYRDLQRHRRAYIKSTMPSMLHGPERWYLANLPDAISKTVLAGWDYSSRDAASVPLMALVSTMIVLDVRQLAYMVRLRTGPTVHPTMRQFMTLVGNMVIGSHPNLTFMLKIDTRPSDYDRRGKQTITTDAGEVI